MPSVISLFEVVCASTCLSSLLFGCGLRVGTVQVFIFMERGVASNYTDVSTLEDEITSIFGNVGYLLPS
jgi:hypothetical protein